MRKLIKRLLKQPKIVKAPDLPDSFGCPECYYVDRGCPKKELIKDGCIGGNYHYEEVNN